MSVKELVIWALTVSWAFIAPVHTLIVATGLLVLFDMVTGIAKAIKTQQKVTSNRMRHTIGKGIAYQIAILTGFLIDTVMGMELMASRVIAGVICLVEGKSVLENIEAMTGISIWSALIEKLKPPTVTTTTVATTASSSTTTTDATEKIAASSSTTTHEPTTTTTTVETSRPPTK